jgi:hypothetical protein
MDLKDQAFCYLIIGNSPGWLLLLVVIVNTLAPVLIATPPVNEARW